MVATGRARSVHWCLFARQFRVLTVTAITAGFTFATMSANPDGFAEVAALISAAPVALGHGAKHAQAISNAQVAASLRRAMSGLKIKRLILDMAPCKSFASPRRSAR